MRGAVLAVLVVVAIAVVPHLLTSRTWLHVANLALIYVPLAIGANVITGYCGMVSMGQAAFFGIGAYASALLTCAPGCPSPSRSSARG